PRRQAAEPYALHLADSGAPPDRDPLTEALVPERRDRATGDDTIDVAPDLLAVLEGVDAHGRARAAARMLHGRTVATGPDVVVPLDPQAFVDTHATTVVAREPQPLENRRRARSHRRADRPRRHPLLVRENYLVRR